MNETQHKVICEPVETLLSWVAGELPRARADGVRAHVLDCLHCQAVLDRETDEASLRAWRGSRQQNGGAAIDPRVLDRLIEKLQSITTIQDQAGTAMATDGRSVRAGEFSEPTGELGTIGPYRLLNELGRGGMGIVYRAWDESLRRLVALKVLRPEQTHETDRLRLIREARITAQFRHEHAVMVHAVANPDDGLPYLVMEYIVGPTLAQLIDSPERPGPRMIATLMAQIADALDAAHAVGLVHRDVKPSNILIENGTGRAKITDFGLARTETGPSSLSREGFLAGTPTYMSPEQARGDAHVDARADVYGLGATFYQALTGVTPFRGAPHLVLRQVIEEDPLPPRRLNDQVPRDLETICLKAMAKEAARRYPSAGALAGDLRHWLKGEPILARPVGLFERAYRWVRRNPRVAGLAAALVLVFTAGFLGVLWQWRRAEKNLKESQISFERARGSVDQFYTRFYEQGVLNVPGLEKVRREVLGEMIRYYKDFLEQHRNDPALRLELAETCQRIGSLTKDLGNKVDALAVLREAVNYFDRLPSGAGDGPQIQTRLYVSLDYIAQLESDLGDIESARRDYHRALGIIEKIVPKEPGNLRRKRGMAVLLGNYANLSVVANDKIQARRGYLQALEIQKDLVRQDPAQLDCKNDLALTYHNLAALAESPQENRALLEQALTLRKQLVELNPGNFVFRHHLGRTYEKLGRNELSLGQTQEALYSLRESRALLQQCVIAHPILTKFQGALASACEILGSTLAALGQHREAQEAFKEARKMYQSLVQSNSESAEYKKLLLEIETKLAQSESSNR
jgi:eukaryotic-like serine/threonine-protein kinase